MYGPDAVRSIAPTEAGGTLVSLRLPCLHDAMDVASEDHAVRYIRFDGVAVR